MPDHCMHIKCVDERFPEADSRYCCWCGLVQHREYSGQPLHGPYLKAESRQWHWAPASVDTECRQLQSS